MWDSQTSFQLKDRSFDTAVGWSEIYRERDFCSAAMAWSFFQSLYRIRSFDSSYSAATTSDNGVRSPTSAILPAGVLPPSRSVQKLGRPSLWTARHGWMRSAIAFLQVLFAGWVHRLQLMIVDYPCGEPCSVATAGKRRLRCTRLRSLRDSRIWVRDFSRE
jgi:hypothetical protein